MKKIIPFLFFVVIFFLSCRKKENIIVRSKVVSDIIVDSAMAAKLGYLSDTVYTLFIPNTFSPDDDGLNDFFKPIGKGDWKSYHFEIRNKYNEKFFETTDTTRAWDGKEGMASDIWVEIGVYKYYVEIKTGIPDVVHKYTGGVLVVH